VKPTTVGEEEKGKEREDGASKAGTVCLHMAAHTLYNISNVAVQRERQTDTHTHMSSL